jgi:hypothetical protein
MGELLEYRCSHVFSIIIWVAARRVRLAEPGPAAFSLKRGFGSTLPRYGRVGQGATRSCSRAKPQGRVYRHKVTPTYLPSYSPDFNPIEEAFSKIKGILRKAEARSREALLEAIGTAISALSAEDTCGFFEHCGYRAVVQLF